MYDRIVSEKVQILGACLMYASPHLAVEMLIRVVTGFQEGLVRQVDDMATLLGDEWSWVSVKCTA